MPGRRTFVRTLAVVVTTACLPACGGGGGAPCKCGTPPLTATPDISDLQSNFGKDSIVVQLSGEAGKGLDQLSNEIQAGTSLETLDTGTPVALHTAVSSAAPGAPPAITFTPVFWDKSKWHKLEIKVPSVGMIQGVPQGDAYFVARFIYDSYLTVRGFQVCGTHGSVLDDAVQVSFSEMIAQPAAGEIVIRQAGSALDCAVVPIGATSQSEVWPVSCKNIDWAQPLEITLASSVGGKALRDLAGNAGYKDVIQLPSGYADQAKWCQRYAQADPSP